MQTLQLSKQKAIELWSTASPEFKVILIESFGEKTFAGDIFQRVNSYEDACKENGTTPLLPFPNPVDDDQISTNAFHMLKEIIKAYREGWTPDMLNSSEYKYLPWFKAEKDSSKAAGFGLSYDGYVYWRTRTVCGVRLFLPTAAKAKYVGNHPEFLKLYNQI
jgi:hypothetical protein